MQPISEQRDLNKPNRNCYELPLKPNYYDLITFVKF